MSDRRNTRETYPAPPTILSYVEPLRALAEMSTLPAAMGILSSAPRGDGHPVMVLPGFLGSDNSTVAIRNYLTYLGYEVYPWALGRNFGPVGDLEDRMVDRVVHIAATHERSVSLVGWSLGGIFARQIAGDAPESVRQVITLGSPFGSPGHGGTNVNIAKLYESISGDSIHDATLDEIRRRRRRPPVPCTAIFSRTDGVAVAEVCTEAETDHTDNIEVCGSHGGLGFNPAVLYAIADRLAQEEDKWAPFDRDGLRSFFYN